MCLYTVKSLKSNLAMLGQAQFQLICVLIGLHLIYEYSLLLKSSKVSTKPIVNIYSYMKTMIDLICKVSDNTVIEDRDRSEVVC